MNMPMEMALVITSNPRGSLDPASPISIRVLNLYRWYAKNIDWGFQNIFSDQFSAAE